ncbi:amidohydrolase [Sediminibacillus massiliensis]|uniref:amidohydrolase n=1 Tax=Sediminibacillus massiliensis TaxID=1926277 RepID=UPI0009887C1B|nr:amidohydrolase [Sediminibacillus massiliensis]
MGSNIEKELKEYVYEMQSHLHEIPEPAFQERKTASYIASQLKELGYTVQEKIAGTGIVAFKEGRKKRPCVAIRADMDCIVHDGHDDLLYRHSCGHDAHSSIALGAAKYLKDRIPELDGSVKFIFQPAEEVGKGARAMTEAGVLNDVDYLIGYHLRTNHECEVGQMAPALYHSAGLKITGEIEGKTAHGGRPHLGINAIDVLHSLISNINTIRTDPMTATNIKFTQISAGKGSLNVIPAHGSFGMDIRSGSNEELEETLEKIKTMIEQTALMHHAEINYNISDGLPAPKYDEFLIETAANSIKKVMGENALVDPISTPGSEDFHNYTKLTEVKATYLAIGANVYPGLHDPEMTFEKEAMNDGVAVVSDMVETILVSKK